MASMRDIKRRKESIQSTGQITKAMKLVSTVKLQRAKARAERSKAYFQCHTDITIPYEELKSISVIKKNGEEIPIISEGRFVLEGTKVLNKALENYL